MFVCSICKTESRPAAATTEIETFFADYLSGKETPYTGRNHRIRVRDIAKEQARVWEAWKRANLNFDEETLIATRPIEEGNAGKWHLPESLEPNAIMNYYWGSKGDKPDGGYSLFLYLHGSGPPDQEWSNGLRFAQTFDDAPSIYFVPQIPNMGSWYRWYQRSKQFAWERLLRLAMLGGEVDPNRIYFFGISEGGYGSQRLASFYADYLAGAGPMAAGEPLKNAPVENCRNTAFSLLTGANDTGFGRNVLTEYTREAFGRLAAQYPGSFIHHIELIPGRGHGIDYTTMTPWLKQHVRNPYPKHVSWENFEMDGRYRKGFHNLAVGQRSNDDTSSRTYYELIIDGNDISLTVDLVKYETTEWLPFGGVERGIEMKFSRSRTPAMKGKVTIYLCPELIDLNKRITVTVNGKRAFSGRVRPELRHIVNSCATFFDPARLYPAAIEVDLETL
ncbi:MAG: hypothetical protein FWE10_01100 [Rikenellaceae bacterium]|nr:hypothetical protein [Rikenellaceae bacterium]MCL2692334.1 hypothetical protein [Rikenellaceae bacterium]